MKWQGWVTALVVAGVCGWLGRGAFSEDPKPAEGGPSQEEMAKVMEALAKPGEMHEWLAKQDGTWAVTGVFHMGGPEPTKTEGTATFKMILGGRWQQQTYTSKIGEMPFEGHGLTGFDNLKKQFVNYWMDTWGTAASVGAGTLNADKTVLTLKGTWDMPQGQMPFTFVLTCQGDKAFTFNATHTLEGAEQPLFEMTYTRT